MKDLSILLQQAKDNYKEKFDKNDFSLTDEFKDKYASYLRNNGQNIVFNEATAIINTTGNLQIYAPNQWFVIASFVIGYLQELIRYKDVVDNALSVRNMSSKEKKDYITKLKEGASEEEIHELHKLIIKYLGMEKENEVRYIVKFLTDYVWWSGSKTIDRSDYYVSPVLNLLGLVNSSQSYVADIAYILASAPDLSDIANKQIAKASILKKETGSVGSLVTKNAERKKGGQNLIVYGAPGTGKSHALEKLLVSGIWENIHYDNFISEYRRVIFHPEYTYFDFVGTYKPIPVYKQTEEIFINSVTGTVNNMEPYIDYQFIPGPFIETLTDAWINPNKMFTLLIEEINRANAAAVFGEIFQLLDRLSDGSSEYVYHPYRELKAYLYSVEGLKEYVSEGIKIPSNMNIVATMNSADQGVNFLDSAFKRRWNYKYKKINIGNAVHKDVPFRYAGILLHWGDFVTALNEKLIKTRVGEDRLIGPYFIKPDEMDSVYATDKLLLYLWDDVLRHQRTQFFSSGILTFSELTEKFSSEDVLELRVYLKSKIMNNENGIFTGEEQEEVIE